MKKYVTVLREKDFVKLKKMMSARMSHGKTKVVQNKCWNDMRECPVTNLVVPATLSPVVKWLGGENYSCCFDVEVKRE